MNNDLVIKNDVLGIILRWSKPPPANSSGDFFVYEPAHDDRFIAGPVGRFGATRVC